MPSLLEQRQAVTDIQDDNRKVRNLLSRAFRNASRIARRSDNPDAALKAVDLFQRGQAQGFQVGGIASADRDRNFAAAQLQMHNNLVSLLQGRAAPATMGTPENPTQTLTPAAGGSVAAPAAGGAVAAPAAGGAVAAPAAGGAVAAPAAGGAVAAPPATGSQVDVDRNAHRARLGLPPVKAPGIYTKGEDGTWEPQEKVINPQTGATTGFAAPDSTEATLSRWIQSGFADRLTKYRLAQEPGGAAYERDQKFQQDMATHDANLAFQEIEGASKLASLTPQGRQDRGIHNNRLTPTRKAARTSLLESRRKAFEEVQSKAEETNAKASLASTYRPPDPLKEFGGALAAGWREGENLMRQASSSFKAWSRKVYDNTYYVQTRKSLNS